VVVQLLISEEHSRSSSQTAVICALTLQAGTGGFTMYTALS